LAIHPFVVYSPTVLEQWGYTLGFISAERIFKKACCKAVFCASRSAKNSFAIYFCFLL